MKSLIEKSKAETETPRQEPELPRPTMNLKIDFDGYDLSICHSKSMEPAPHIEELFEAILAKDVNPFNPKDVEAYQRLTNNPLFCIRSGDYYLIIPDSPDYLKLCRTMGSSKGIRWDAL